MKTKHYILLALAGLTAFLAGFIIGKDRTEKPPGTVKSRLFKGRSLIKKRLEDAGYERESF